MSNKVKQILGFIILLFVAVTIVACAPVNQPCETREGFVLEMSGNNCTYTQHAGAAAVVAAPAEVVISTDPMQNHFARLESLDPSFRSGGWNAWLSAAGIQCESTRDARQPEEETNPATGKISVAGLQVVVKNCSIPWPNIVTTDVASRITESNTTVKYQPDPSNGSVLYTNVVANGEVTIWGDGQNWGQFTSKLGFVNNAQASAPVEPAAPEQPEPVADVSCMSISELDEKYGVDTGALGTTDGRLIENDQTVGATLTLTAAEIAELESMGWVIQGTNPVTKSAWSPESCRPLSE